MTESLFFSMSFDHLSMFFHSCTDACVCRAGIKAIKLHAWEAPFERRINHLREVELQQIRRATYPVSRFSLRRGSGTG